MKTHKPKKAVKTDKPELPKAVRMDSRICFGIYWFLSEEDAQAYAAYIRSRGDTYNGGWFHGMACGRDKSFDYAVPADEKLSDGEPVLPVGTLLYAVTTA